MTPLADVAIRVTVIVGLALLTAAALRRRSAALRHAVLTAGLVAVALAPALGVLLPAWTVALPGSASSHEPRPLDVRTVPEDVTLTAVPNPEAAASPTAFPLASVLAATWAMGSLLGFTLLVRTLHRVRTATSAGTGLSSDRWQRLRRESVALVRFRGDVELRSVTGVPAPAAWGLRRPYVLLPSAARHWDDERVVHAVAHELAHVARRDWPVLLGAAAVQALYWWHPLVHLAARRLRLDSEIACDDRVVAAGVVPCDYAAHIVAIARDALHARTPWAGVVAMAQPPSLERRIRTMLATHDRRPLPLRHGVAIAALAAFATAALVSVHAQPAQADLRGTVYDSSGAVVPEVALTLVGADDARLTAFTQSDGSFSFPAIAAGTYTLEARLPGFQKLSESFELSAARDWDRAITLQLGTLQEEINIVASRTTAAASTAPAGPAPLRVGGNIKAPMKLKDVKPVYPPAMRADGREGEVQLEAIIDGEGAVKSVRVLGAHVHPDFALAAADAVRQWRFSPTLLNGVPVEVLMNVKMSFRLENGTGQ